VTGDEATPAARDAVAVSVMDIGGTHVTAAHAAVSADGLRLRALVREPLDSLGSAGDIVSALVRCAERLPGPVARHWSVAVPGPFDYEQGIGRYEGVGKFDALRGYDVRAALTARLPGRPTVDFCNDADAFVLGEWQAGAARGHGTVAGITLGSGIGSCFLRDGTILREGAGVPPEGRLHLLQHAGRPLEDTVSRRALRRAYARAAAVPAEPDVHEIAERARRGDAVAVRVFTRAFRALGQELGPLLAALRPEVLVVGGSIAGSWDLVVAPLRDGIAQAGAQASGVDVVPAQLPTEAALFGAAWVACAGRC
jgi:glucokinase